MNNSMISAMVSMNGIQQRLDVIADNMANLDTIGYKRKEASFEDTLSRIQKQSSDFKLPGRVTPLGFNMGFGSKLSSVNINYAQGSINETGKPTDLAIEGNAMFSVLGEGGVQAYTRAGDFHLQSDPANPESAYLVTKEGHVLLNSEGNPIAFPANAKLDIDGQGNIRAAVGNEITEVGRIGLYTPLRPESLEQRGGNLFVVTAGEDGAMVATTTEASIRQGAIEGSNVKLADEMAEMMQVQRAYQLAARALTSSENMMSLANNLRG